MRVDWVSFEWMSSRGKCSLTDSPILHVSVSRTDIIDITCMLIMGYVPLQSYRAAHTPLLLIPYDIAMKCVDRHEMRGSP